VETERGGARFNMIEQQLRPWGVLDMRVLDAMSGLPREPFVPDAYRGLAYADIEIPIGEGHVMLAPKAVGRLLQALAVEPGERVLEVGTGSGYVTACLCRLEARVVSLEIDPGLAAAARERLAALDLGPAEVIVGDALAGDLPNGPFDAIVVTASVPVAEILRSLEDRLAVGGRLFSIVGEPPVMQAQLAIRVAAGDLRRTSLFETCVPALANCPEPEGFVF
jgi:protein-L-isoaspartate(D-aspartate) O-methyltransferase